MTPPARPCRSSRPPARQLARLPTARPSIPSARKRSPHVSPGRLPPPVSADPTCAAATEECRYTPQSAPSPPPPCRSHHRRAAAPRRTRNKRRTGTHARRAAALTDLQCADRIVTCPQGMGCLRAVECVSSALHLLRVCDCGTIADRHRLLCTLVCSLST